MKESELWDRGEGRGWAGKDLSREGPSSMCVSGEHHHWSPGAGGQLGWDRARLEAGRLGSGLNAYLERVGRV